jgi:cellulose synthase (UDP-forming)
MRQQVLRVLAVLTVVAGVVYLVWRWSATIPWDRWWIGVPLALAETSTLVALGLLGLTMSRLRRSTDAPAPVPGTTVDVFVTTHDEPLDLVMGTVTAARDIRYPHRTWVLDDGARPELAAAVAAAGVEYVQRSADWSDRPRHAKAGNLNNALFQTEGEVLLVLEADRVPDPAILDRTLGHLADDRVALVQLPRSGSGAAAADPLDVLSPLLPGPVQEGKAGWGAAFANGADVLLRRDALMQLGLVGYVRETERGVHDALAASRRLLENARRATPDPAQAAVLGTVEQAAATAQSSLAAGGSVTEVTFAFQREVDRISATVVADDVARMQEDLRALGALPIQRDEQLDAIVVDEAALTRLADREWSPLGAIESVQALVRAVDVGRSDEAQALLPVPTSPVTEDAATAMQLHALGWRTVYHDEQLTRPAVPLDGGLSAGQRLMYLATGWAYLAGFAALVYLAVPAVFLLTGVPAVDAGALDADLGWRFAGYAVLAQALLAVSARGLRHWRGQQLSIAVFPTWLHAAVTGTASAWSDRPIRSTAGRPAREGLRAVWPQVAAMVLLVLAALVGVVRAAADGGSWTPTVVHLCWAGYLIVVLSAATRAVRPRADGTLIPKEA